nr:YfhO family protein [Clostridiales bacterium]
NENNRLYRREYDNGVLDLGNFDGGEVTVEIGLLAEGASAADISFAAMDCRALSALCEDYNSGKRGEVELTARGDKSLEFRVNNTGEGEKTLFIPVNYDGGMRCRIDGKKSETKLICGTFTGVSVPAGEHTVKLSFTPSGTGTGAALSAVGALVFAGALWFLKKDRTAKLPPFAVRFVTALFFLIFAAFVVLGYLLPFFGGLVSALRGA